MSFVMIVQKQRQILYDTLYFPNNGKQLMARMEGILCTLTETEYV